MFSYTKVTVMRVTDELVKVKKALANLLRITVPLHPHVRELPDDVVVEALAESHDLREIYNKLYEKLHEKLVGEARGRKHEV